MTQSVLFFRRCGLLLLLPWVAAAELRISEICPKPGERFVVYTDGEAKPETFFFKVHVAK